MHQKGIKKQKETNRRGGRLGRKHPAEEGICTYYFFNDPRNPMH
jgi:hypothetical protein